MSKIFKTSDDIVELIENQFAETGLEPYGINLKVLSTVKSKELMTVTKESAKTEYLSKSRDLITLTVYEALFDRLDDEAKNMLIEMYLSGVSYDSEKDKILVDKNPVNLILNMRRKYGDDILNKVELVQMVMQEMIEEEKEKKRQEKEAKKARKNNG